MDAQNQSARLIETQLEKVAFCSYLPTQHLQLSFLMVSIKSFRNEAFAVWMLF